MKLYGFCQSSSAYRVRIALNIKGLDPEHVFVNLTKGEQRDPAYAAINPQMAVPSLVEEGQVLTQSLAIMEYLEERYPLPPLLPGDLFDRARVRALAQAVALDIAPLNNLKVRKYLLQFGLSEEEVKVKWIQHWIADGFRAIEQMLSTEKTGVFCHGDTPTIADCCLIPQVFNARRFGCNLAPYPTIMRIVAACEQHPAFVAAHPENQPDYLR